MKKNYFKLFTVLLVLLFVSMQMVSAQNFVGHYKLDATTGTTAVDASGNGLNVPLNGISDENWVDGSLYLDGTQYGQIDPPASNPFKLESLTVSAWIKHDAEMVDWGDWICAQGDNWGLYLNGEEGLNFYIHHADDWGGVTDGATALYLEGGWHYVVATFDATTLTAKLYRDGEMVGENTLPGNIVYSEGDNFNIGAMSGERFWKGNIRDLRIMDGVASESMIATYGFNEGSGTTVADASGNAFDGTLNGDPMWVMGKSGSAVAFSNDNMQMPDDVAFTQSTFTISSWINITDSLDNDWRAIYIHDKDGDNEVGMLVNGEAWGGNPAPYNIAIWAPGIGGDWLDGNTQFELNKWYHVAFTVDADGVGTLYVNGKIDGTAGNFHALSDETAVGVTTIGGSADGTKDFPGITMDDFGFYSEALSGSEIAGIMRKSISGSTAYWTFAEQGPTVTIDTIIMFDGDELPVDTVVNVATAEDVTGNGFDLYMVNATDDSWKTDEAVGNYVEFNGTNQYGMLDLETTSSMFYPDFTIATYIKIEPGVMTEWARIAGISDAFGFNVDGGFVGMWCNYDDGWHGSYATTLPIDDGEWHYIAMTHSNTAGNIYYVDGQVALVQDWSSEGGNQIAYPGERPFAVGTSISDWGTPDVGLIRHNLIPASMSKLHIYDKVLSKDELGGAASGLIANYNYETVSGSTVPDVTVNELNGWCGNYEIVEGKEGASAIQLNNSNVRLPDDAIFNQNTLTIASWINITEEVGDDWYSVMIHDQGGVNEYGLLVMDSRGIAFHAPGFGLEEITDWNGGAFDLNTWYHYAVTVDAAGECIIYINGEAVYSATGGHPLADLSAIGETYVGGSADGGKNFPGILMDDTRFYGTALSAEEIMLLVATSYTLNVNVVGQGAVSLSPEGGEYLEGTEVEMTATPIEGFDFVGWSGDLSSTDNPLTVTMDTNMNVTATFEPSKYALNVTIVGNGSVTPTNGDYSGEVFLTAVPDEGWAFENWSGDATGTDNPLFLSMSEDKNITATFIDISGIDNPEMKEFSLNNYPNPFTGMTTISYSLKEASDISLTVYSQLGEVVIMLVSQTQIPGDYKYEFNGTELTNGIYYYQFKSGNRSVTNKMVLNK